MKYFTILLSILISSALADAKPNVLLICVDDLRPELRCYGVDYISSPNIDRLAQQSRLFDRHYVQAPTCGASRYALLTGCYGGANNEALFKRAALIQESENIPPPSMPAWFREAGYTTVAVGKVSHHPGGQGGPDWNDPMKLEMPNSWDRQLLPFGPWQHPRGWMHGLANGQIRIDASKMDVFEADQGDDSSYPDGPSVEAMLTQIDRLANDGKPFFLACGILRPHLPFGAPAKYLEPYADRPLPKIKHPTKPTGKTTWHRSGEFMKYNRWGKDPNVDSTFADAVRRHYAACVSYADAQVGKLLNRLDERKIAKDTIVVLWGDHGWHLGEHGVWGKHTLFEESLRSPLLIKSPMLKQPGTMTKQIVESVDIFPTLAELCEVPIPDFVQGESLKPLIDDPNHVSRSGELSQLAFSYFRNDLTLRSETHRLILHDDGFVELYDHTSEARETKNIGDANPDLVSQLRSEISKRGF